MQDAPPPMARRLRGSIGAGQDSGPSDPLNAPLPTVTGKAMQLWPIGIVGETGRIDELLKMPIGKGGRSPLCRSNLSISIATGRFALLAIPLVLGGQQ
jgi:hypothetical protein